MLEPYRCAIGDAFAQAAFTWNESNETFSSSVKEGDWVRIQVAAENLLDLSQEPLSLKLQQKPHLSCLQRSIKEPKLELHYEVLRQRQHIISQLRLGLQALGMEEVETPFLVPCGGIEPTLKPFSTQWQLGSQLHQFHLPTSPELHLKRLMLQGWTDIFEFKSCFRNDEYSEYHQPEFLMLEWYRAFFNLTQFAQDIENLLNHWVLGGKCKLLLQKRSMSSLFDEFIGVKLNPYTSVDELKDWVSERGGPSELAQQDELFDWLFIRFIEPQLKQFGPVLIDGFMPFQKALARLTPDGWADRMELYLNGVEIANAFNEETDPDRLVQQFEADQTLRTKIFGQEFATDNDFLELIKQGLPPAYGVALGVDRLVMALLGIEQISQSRFFSKHPS